jgi:hypothetical protein
VHLAVGGARGVVEIDDCLVARVAGSSANSIEPVSRS